MAVSPISTEKGGPHCAHTEFYLEMPLCQRRSDMVDFDFKTTELITN